MLYTNHFLMELCFIGHYKHHYVIIKVILVSWMPDMALYVTTFFTTWQCSKGEWHYTIATFPMLQIGFSLHPLTRPSLIDNDVACYVQHIIHGSIKMHIFILPDPHISFICWWLHCQKKSKAVSRITIWTLLDEIHKYHSQE